MDKVAILLTCFNRREKTIKALTALNTAFEQSETIGQMSVYLTDDGSSDGTSEAVSAQFPDVHILKGTGNLYWAGGMRNSWGQALQGNYDAYLLLNDDTEIYPHLFDAIAKTNAFCISNYGKGGVYVGTTIDAETKKVSYGGSVFINKFLATSKRLEPQDTPISCELGNANIMWVCKNVVDEVGILSEGYVHGLADYDYTLKAVKKNLPTLIMPGVVGECINDHKDPYQRFFKLSFKERYKMLYNPIGFDFASHSHYMKKYFPHRYPLFLITGYFKVVFPKLYYHLLYKNRKH